MSQLKLSGNQLKIIAAIFMTIDHIGAHLFPQYEILRIIGRLSMPIFAYMIAEGSFYTKNRKKYLCTIGALALFCQLVSYIADKSLYQCILVTFALSIALIYLYDNGIKNKKHLAFFVYLTAVFFVSEILPLLLHGFKIDYGFFGILLPLLIYAGNDKKQKLLLLTFGLVMLSINSGSIQWWSLLSVPIIALYNRQRGKYKMKNFFYIYYPLHLGIIYLIGIIKG